MQEAMQKGHIFNFYPCKTSLGDKVLSLQNCFIVVLWLNLRGEGQFFWIIQYFLSTNSILFYFYWNIVINNVILFQMYNIVICQLNTFLNVHHNCNYLIAIPRYCNIMGYILYAVLRFLWLTYFRIGSLYLSPAYLFYHLLTQSLW